MDTFILLATCTQNLLKSSTIWESSENSIILDNSLLKKCLLLKEHRSIYSHQLLGGYNEIRIVQFSENFLILIHLIVVVTNVFNDHFFSVKDEGAFEEVRGEGKTQVS